MVYRFGERTEQAEAIPDAWLGDGTPKAAYLTPKKYEKTLPVWALNGEMAEACRGEVRHFRSNVEFGEDCCLITVKRTGGGEEGEDCIALCVEKDLLTVVDIRDSDGSTRRGFDSLSRLRSGRVTQALLTVSFLDTLTEGDARRLEALETTFSKWEEGVLRGEDTADFTARLLHYKQQLLRLHQYYEQLIDIGQALAQNSPRLFPQKELRHFSHFIDRAERLCRTVAALREQLGQLREAYQSVLDLRQSQMTKAFTLLSAVFLPLTLIVGWYGMNFRGMPELDWRYGYPFAALLCVFVVLFCIRIFKKHHWI